MLHRHGPLLYSREIAAARENHDRLEVVVLVRRRCVACYAAQSWQGDYRVRRPTCLKFLERETLVYLHVIAQDWLGCRNL